ncbi:hypothetical protein ACFRI7_14725 [Streptomyces sp. NPDC056716]|uniref:hypothetical protein n=1 Tax=unclassified Streptomyces TaxID=2593676 RepID=UPI0036CC1CF6
MNGSPSSVLLAVLLAVLVLLIVVLGAALTAGAAGWLARREGAGLTAAAAVSRAARAFAAALTLQLLDQ